MLFSRFPRFIRCSNNFRCPIRRTISIFNAKTADVRFDCGAVMRLPLYFEVGSRPLSPRVSLAKYCFVLLPAPNFLWTQCWQVSNKIERQSGWGGRDALDADGVGLDYIHQWTSANMIMMTNFLSWFNIISSRKVVSKLQLPHLTFFNSFAKLPLLTAALKELKIVFK